MAIQIEEAGSRLYVVGDTFAHKNEIKALGGHWDGERRAWWVGTAKRPQIEELVARLSDPNAPKPKQDPDDIRLTGKGRYKGRDYFAGSITRDGLKVRLLTLPNEKGEFLDFWASCSEVEEIKRYEPRERSFRGRTEVTYTTLGSIAKFVASQKKAEAEGKPACGVCGKRGDLHHDLETGMMCCYSCCDMPE